MKCKRTSLGSLSRILDEGAQALDPQSPPTRNSEQCMRNIISSWIEFYTENHISFRHPSFQFNY